MPLVLSLECLVLSYVGQTWMWSWRKNGNGNVGFEGCGVKQSRGRLKADEVYVEGEAAFPYGLVVRISDSHSGGRGSIPRGGSNVQPFASIAQLVRAWC